MSIQSILPSFRKGRKYPDRVKFTIVGGALKIILGGTAFAKLINPLPRPQVDYRVLVYLAFVKADYSPQSLQDLYSNTMSISAYYQRLDKSAWQVSCLTDLQQWIKKIFIFT